MPTIQQLVRNGGRSQPTRAETPALKGAPQRRGVCTRVSTKGLPGVPYLIIRSTPDTSGVRDRTPAHRRYGAEKES